MNIIIFGASGKTGHELVNQALEQGHNVTAFVRKPDKLNVKHQGLNVIQGDVINYQLVEEAIKGNDAVISALGASSPFKFDQSVVDGFGNIINAMEHNHINRLIYMSFIGVKESYKNAGFVIKYITPKILSTEIAGHEAREKMIKRSQLDWTIVRPPTLTNGKLTKQIRSGENSSANGFTVTISRADVAYFMVEQLNHKAFIKKVALIMH